MPPVTKHVIDETYVRRWRTNNWWGYEQPGSKNYISKFWFCTMHVFNFAEAFVVVDVTLEA